MTIQDTKYTTIRRSCFFLLFLFIYIFAQGQNDTIANALEQKTISVKEITDTEVTFRIPPESKIVEYQDDSRFQYGETFFLVKLFQRIVYWIGDFIDSALRATSSLSGLSQVIVYSLGTIFLIVIVVFIILRVKKIDIRTLLGKKKIDTPEIEIYTENVHEMNFDTLISNALKNKDFRLATRFLYLRNLKYMTDNGIIKWNINKTNYSYQHEIKDTELRSKFLETTFIFDYVWYGEFSVDEYQFVTVEKSMNDFSKMASNEK